MGELTLNIDTSQFAGGDSEKARVWGSFAMVETAAILHDASKRRDVESRVM